MVHKKSTKPSSTEHVVGILCYVVIGLLWYLLDPAMKKSTFVSFHVKQALNLFIFSIGLSIAGSIPFIGLIIAPLGGLFIMVLWVFGLIYSISGEQKEVPLIGILADRYLTF